MEDTDRPHTFDHIVSLTQKRNGYSCHKWPKMTCIRESVVDVDNIYELKQIHTCTGLSLRDDPDEGHPLVEHSQIQVQTGVP